MKEPLRLEDGELHQFLVKVAGEPFYCKCGCNVFHKPDKNDLETYKCNCCGTTYTAKDKEE